MDSKLAQDVVLKEIQAALNSNETSSIRSALAAVRGTYQLDFDRSPFRELVRRHLKSEYPDVRVGAIYALITCKPDDSDRQRVLELIPNCTEDEMSALAFAMQTVSGSDLTGEFAQPMLDVLERGMAAAQRDRGNNLGFDGRGVLGAIWGSKVSPQIEARLVEWSHLSEEINGVMNTGGLGYETFYHALSVQSNKSHAAVKRILELAYNPDTTNIAGRCLWGLNGTVPDPADQAYVATEVIKLLGLRSGDNLWRRGLTLLATYSNKDHLSTLEELAQREALPQARKEALNKIITDLRAKP